MCKTAARWAWRSHVLSLAALVAVGTAGSADASMMADWQQKETIGAIDSDNYDLAIGGGRAHVTYQDGGNVYYVSRSLYESAWSIPRLIGAGSLPSIAVGTGGAAHIAYHHAGGIYASASASGWAPVNVGAGSSTTLGIGADGTRHVLIEGNFDGDGYTEIGHRLNSGGGWSPMTVLHDGWHADGTGTYFGQTSVAALADGGYAYAMESQAWFGNASASGKYPAAIISGGPYTKTKVSWEAGASLSRRAIAAGPDGVGFAFSSGGVVYADVMMGGEWVGVIPVGLGAQASVDMSGVLSVAYVQDGDLMFYDGLVSTPIAVGGISLGGSRPMVAGDGNNVFVMYRDTSGKLELVSTMVIPEPGAMGMIVLGAGAALLARRRK